MGSLSRIPGIADFFIPLVWLVWLIASLYLIAMSGYYAFLSVVFTGYSIRAHVQPSFIEYIVSAASGSIPLLCSVAIAIVGFFLWRIARFRILGLWIISIEGFLALYLFEDPVRMLSFVELLK